MTFAKRVLVLALGLAIWLVSPKAFAAAPRCDVRAATTFAPTPFVDDVRSSVDLGVADCGDESPIDLFVNPGGHGSSEITFTATPNATLSSNAIVLHAPRSALLPRVFETRDAPTGIRSTVERPPR